MNNSFGVAAATYDSSFTNSPIGRLQRKHVWNYLEKVLPSLRGNKILELNCGTGEDAIYFGNKGFSVLATDISTDMISQANDKVSMAKMEDRISLLPFDLTDLPSLRQKDFDLVFSNFGGLNCVNAESLAKILDDVAKLLTTKGRFIAVIMPKFCLWEFLYFVIKFQGSKAIRRIKGNSMAQIGEATIPVWYHSSGEVKKIAKNKFHVRQCLPIGFSIPPSYLNSGFENRESLLKQLDALEIKFNSMSWLSNFSDHFLIDLQLK